MSAELSPVSDKLHIVWVKTELLHPVDKGGRIRTYKMLAELRREHRVTYVCLDDGTAAPDAVKLASEYCHDLVRIPFRTAAKGSVRFFTELLANLVSPLPYAVSKYKSPEMRRQLDALVAAERPDVVVCDFLSPSVNVSSNLGVPTVLFQHNVETMIWDRHATVPQSRLRAAYMRRQARRMAAFERAECERFDRVVAVSEQDATYFEREFGLRDVAAVPTGVDTDYFRPTGGAARNPHELVFTGSMDWMPNQDAIQYFVDDIFPRIRARVPDATLSVVGRNPSPRMLQLEKLHPGVRVTGSVPDVRPYLENGAVFVVPIRVGGGTRLKIYEAMGMECPVVSTTVGAEGLPVDDGIHVRLVDEPAAFADAVVALLDRPAEGRRLAQSAARLVRESFSWRSVAEKFASICSSVVTTQRGTSRDSLELTLKD